MPKIVHRETTMVGKSPTTLVGKSPATLPAAPPTNSLPDSAELASLIQACFPDMPRLSAEALASVEWMSPVLSLTHAWRQALTMPNLSETIVVILASFTREAALQIEQVIAEKPAYQQAIRQSGYAFDTQSGLSRSPAN